MTYAPKYTSAAKVEGLTQFAAGAATNPSDTEILAWIEEVETDADARDLYQTTHTDEIIDIVPELEYPAKGTIAWLESISGQPYIEACHSILVPPHTPIVSISKLYRRTSGLAETAAWEELTEGPSSTGSFIIIKKKTKTGQYLGIAIYFYQNEPDIGYGRVKMTYISGWNLSTTILGEWCSLKVALKVMDSVINATTPTGSSGYGLGDARIDVDQMERKMSLWLKRIEEIEKEYFPRKMGMAFI